MVAGRLAQQRTRFDLGEVDASRQCLEEPRIVGRIGCTAAAVPVEVRVPDRRRGGRRRGRDVSVTIHAFFQYCERRSAARS